MLKFFVETDIDSIGDWEGHEKTVVDIIDSIKEAIETNILNDYPCTQLEIENITEVSNMIWEYLCGYENEEIQNVNNKDIKRIADKIYGFAIINKWDD